MEKIFMTDFFCESKGISSSLFFAILKMLKSWMIRFSWREQSNTQFRFWIFRKTDSYRKNNSKVLYRKLVSLTRDFQFTVTVLFLVPIPFLLLLISLHLFWLSPFIQNFSSSHEIVHCRFGIANEFSFIVNSSLVLEELTYPPPNMYIFKAWYLDLL